MKKKNCIKMVTDIFMTIALLVLMTYQMAGSEIHEWLGAGIFLLLVLHHILNMRWIRNLFHGKYTPFRILQTIVLGLVIISILASLYSGIVLSRYIFKDISIPFSKSTARVIHMLAAYWGFLFMGVHLGLHWNMVVKIIGYLWKKESKIRNILLRIIVIGIVVYGVYAFIHRKFLQYMFLQNRFVFFDFGEPIALFLMDYLAVFSLFVCIGYYSAKIIVEIKVLRAM